MLYTIIFSELGSYHYQEFWIIFYIYLYIIYLSIRL